MSGLKQIDAVTTIAELAAIVSKHLTRHNITSVLSGGAVVTIYVGENLYESGDLDFISPENQQKIVEIMKLIGFEPITKHNRVLARLAMFKD